LNQIAHVGVSPSRGLKLFGRLIIFEVPERHTQTDRQTDGRMDNILWHNRALRSIAR